MKEFNEYTKRIADIRIDGKGKREAYEAYFADYRKRYEKPLNDKTLSKEDREYYKACLKEIDATKAKKMKELNEEFSANLNAVIDEARSEHKSFAKLSPDSLDQGAITLLNSGMMKLEDYEQFAETYKDNYTMLKIISDNIEKQQLPKYEETSVGTVDVRNRSARQAYISLNHKIKGMCSNEEFIKDLESVGNMARKSLDDNKYTANVYDKKFSELFEADSGIGTGEA